MRSIPSIQSFPHKNSHFLVYTQLHTRILFCPCVQLSLCSLCCQIQSTPSILSATNSTVWYLHTVSVNYYNLLHTHILFYSCVLFPLFSLFHTKTVSFLFTHSYTHAFCSAHALTFALHSILSNTVDSIYIVSYKLYSLVLTYSQFQSLQLASHTHSVLLMRSIPSIQSFPHKNSQFLVYTQLHTRILFCPCVQLSLCSLCCQIQSTPSILSATNSTVWYLHTVSVNHYNLLHTHILFYSCVLFPLFSLFHTKTVSFLFTHSYTHAFCSAHALTFALHSILSNTVDSIYIVSYKLYSLVLTYSQFQSLQLASHTHSVLLMRSIPSIQSFPHKNSQFLVYTQLHTRILFCPCVNFRFAFHSVKYSRLHLYCQLQTVQSGTYIQSVSIITTCYTQLFCSTHAFYSIYIVLFLINSYLLVCTLL